MQSPHQDTAGPNAFGKQFSAESVAALKTMGVLVEADRSTTQVFLGDLNALLSCQTFEAVVEGGTTVTKACYSGGGVLCKTSSFLRANLVSVDDMQTAIENEKTLPEVLADAAAGKSGPSRKRRRGGASADADGAPADAPGVVCIEVWCVRGTPNGGGKGKAPFLGLVPIRTVDGKKMPGVVKPEYLPFLRAVQMVMIGETTPLSKEEYHKDIISCMDHTGMTAEGMTAEEIKKAQEMHGEAYEHALMAFDFLMKSLQVKKTRARASPDAKAKATMHPAATAAAASAVMDLTAPEPTLPAPPVRDFLELPPGQSPQARRLIRFMLSGLLSNGNGAGILALISELVDEVHAERDLRLALEINLTLLSHSSRSTGFSAGMMMECINSDLFRRLEALLKSASEAMPSPALTLGSAPAAVGGGGGSGGGGAGGGGAGGGGAGASGGGAGGGGAGAAAGGGVVSWNTYFKSTFARPTGAR
jgi:hypothetical protein